jgi:hypothetical protein
MSDVETYEFRAATPVKRAGRKGAGRKPTPNPFIDAVRGIAGTVDANGQAEARESAVLLDVHCGETYKQRYSRVRRQLTAAGKLIAQERGAVEPFRIEMSLRPVSPESVNELILTIWDRDAAK